MRLLIGAVLTILAAACASTATPSPSSTAVGPPVGTFATDRAVLGLCVAVRVDAGTLQNGVATAWYWDPGASGDCSSRTSGLVAATAGAGSASAITELRVSIPEMSGPSRQMRFAVQRSPGGLSGTVTTNTEASAVRLVAVATVDPTFQPAPTPTTATTAASPTSEAIFPTPSTTVWLPGGPDRPPTAVINRDPLPLCGVVGPAGSATVRQCVLDAYQAGYGAEMVMEDGPLTVILRVLPGHHVETIYRTTSPNLPDLWEIASCGTPRAPELNATDIGVNCGPLTAL